MDESVHKQATHVVNTREHVRVAYESTIERFPGGLDERDAFNATLDYIWHVCRCAVFISVRDYRVRAFIPFCALDFHNDWNLNTDAITTEPGTLEPSRWWANADLICSKPQGLSGWGTSQLETYLEMFEAVLREHPVRYAAFFLNKRDHPLIRIDGTAPYHHVWAGLPPRVWDPSGIGFLPVLSPYTGVEFADRMIPTSVCWSEIVNPTSIKHVAWKKRKPVAFFRGTATNEIRVELCRRFGNHPCFDVALTHAAGGRLVAHDGVVTRTPPSGDKSAYIEPTQWGNYKVIIVPDGHSAANRWTHALYANAWVVRLTASVAPMTPLADIVAHETIDATVDGWGDRLEAIVRTLIGRRGGPRKKRYNIRTKVTELVARNMQPNSIVAAKKCITNATREHVSRAYEQDDGAKYRQQTLL